MRTPLLCAVLAALAPAVSADRFYFGSEAEDKKFIGVEGAEHRSVISGVLLREQDGMCVIRVEGGEVWVERSRIYKIDKDDLTVAKIEERERAAQERLAQAERKRQTQIAEAAARRSERPVAEEQPKSLTVEIDFDGLLPGYKFRPNSDVLRRVDLVRLSREIQDWLSTHGEPPPPGAKQDFTVNIDFKGLLPGFGFRIYDPVIHRVDLRGLARRVEDVLRAEVEAAANRAPRRVH